MARSPSNLQMTKKEGARKDHREITDKYSPRPNVKRQTFPHMGISPPYTVQCLFALGDQPRMALEQIPDLASKVVVMLDLRALHRVLQRSEPVEDGRVLSLCLAQLFAQLLLRLLHFCDAA